MSATISKRCCLRPKSWCTSCSTLAPNLQMNDSVNASAMLCCYVVSAGSEQAASLTNDVLPCSWCTDVFALRFKLVAADPVAYYNILESACGSAVRGQEGSSSHNNSSEPGSSSRSSGQGQENRIRKLGGKKSKGSGSRSRRSSSVCKAENASKGSEKKEPGLTPAAAAGQRAVRSTLWYGRSSCQCSNCWILRM